MTKTIRFHETGGPEVLRFEDVDVGEPGRGEACVRHLACGLNFIDIYQRSGLYKVPLPFELGLLGQKGSLFLTRPSLFTYTAKRKDLEATAQELFDIVQSGRVKIEIEQRYALKDAAQAHRDMEARKTVGASILLP